MKEIIYRILREKGLLVTDAEDIFAAMGEILLEAANRLEEREPYARYTIQDLRSFSQIVDNLNYFIEQNP